jgi:hypothetical protein
MTESPTPSTFAKWKRALIGGLLSAGVVGLATGLAPLLDYFMGGGDDISSILTKIFSVFPLLLMGIGGDVPPLILTISFWFLVGATITFFIKSNKGAIRLWIVFLVLMTGITFCVGATGADW